MGGIRASFKTRMEKIQLNIIQCYAPTNAKDEGTKEDFYNKLQTVLDKMKKKDVTILMGDFNAYIGSNNRGYEEVMGTHGIGEMNENGEMFAGLCSFNRLMIGGSVFPHRRIHKATWVSPDHQTENHQPYLHKSEIQEIDARCKSTQRGRCSLRSPSSADKTEVETEEHS